VNSNALITLFQTKILENASHACNIAKHVVTRLLVYIACLRIYFIKNNASRSVQRPTSGFMICKYARSAIRHVLHALIKEPILAFLAKIIYFSLACSQVTNV